MDTNGKKSINPNRFYSQPLKKSINYSQPLENQENAPIKGNVIHRNVFGSDNVADAYTLGIVPTAAPIPLVQYQPTPGTMGF